MPDRENVPVVILGGGFAGLETALYLRDRLGDRVRITLVSDRAYFLFRPFLTYVPFGLRTESIKLDLLAFAAAHGLRFVEGRVEAVYPEGKRVDVGEEVLHYDYLVVATGATLDRVAIPGLQEHAYTLWRERDMQRLREAFRNLLNAVEAGARRSVVFLVPTGCQWAGALYEMAFTLSTWLQWKEIRKGVDIRLATSEPAFMQVFGPDVHVALQQEFERHGIWARADWDVHRVQRGVVTFANGSRWSYDILIKASPFVASGSYDLLPVDARGFLRTEPHTRRVVGHPDVYAVGDASDFPVKQAYLALLQADAAAEHITARVLEREPAFGFQPESLWLMEQLDQALFVRPHVGSRAAGAGVDEEAGEVRRLPVGEFRRLHIGAYLPRPLAGADPLYAGLLWKGTKTGLKVLSHLIHQESEEHQ